MESIIEAIGHTPLVHLKRSLPAGHADLFAKLERFNPGGSLKDRIVFKIISEAEKTGRLKKGDAIVGGTTGNSGIALAYLSNIKGYRVILTMPENYSLERRKILEGYGAEVHLTPTEEGMEGALKRARDLAQEKGWFFFSQFDNPLTIQAHAESTAVEIETALARTVDAVVATFGTGGSLMGVGGYFKRRGAKVVAVEAAGCPLLTEGRGGRHNIQGASPGFISPNLKKDLIDQIIVVSDEQAYDGAREVARLEGILAGISSGAAFVAARKVARLLGPGKTVVTIFPDGGERYLSEGIR